MESKRSRLRVQKFLRFTCIPCCVRCLARKRIERMNRYCSLNDTFIILNIWSFFLALVPTAVGDWVYSILYYAGFVSEKSTHRKICFPKNLDFVSLDFREIVSEPQLSRSRFILASCLVSGLIIGVGKGPDLIQRWHRKQVQKSCDEHFIHQAQTGMVFVVLSLFPHLKICLSL